MWHIGPQYSVGDLSKINSYFVSFCSLHSLILIPVLHHYLHSRGRFGVVKKCVELDTATRFCAKFIKSRPSQKEEFKREIDVMNVLHHPRIIRLQDAFEEPRQIILIME